MLNLLLSFLAALAFPTWISDSTIAFSNSVFSLCLWIAVFLLLRAGGKLAASRRLKVCSHVLGLLFSTMIAYGHALGDGWSAIPYLSVPFIFSILLYAHVIGQGLALLWRAMDRRLCITPPDARISLPGCIRSLYEHRLWLFALLILCWMPCYISTFPGNFMYDASYEYFQLEYGYSASYPLLHSFITTRLLALSERLTGSVNPGIAVYTIVQMLCSAALFAHILHQFHRYSLHPVALGLFTAYYALFPVVHLLITCTTRDVFFSVMLTWLIYLFYVFSRDKDAFMARRRNLLLLAAVLVFTLLARNNNSGPLASILLVAVCAILGLVLGRRNWKRSLAFAAVSLGLFYSVSAFLLAHCQPYYSHSSLSASMSIIAQPLVRTYTLYGDTWPEEDIETFESFFTMETLEYVPQNADPAKGNLQLYYRNIRQFIPFWFKIGLRYPACYLDGIFANTREMWFPDSLIDGYTVREAEPRYYDKCYFHFGRYAEEIGSRLNLLPGVFAFYEWIGLRLSFEKIPVVSMLFSIGFQVWLLLFLLFYVVYRKRRPLLLPIMVLFIYVVCSAFTPLVLLRYYSALFLAMPILIAAVICPSAPAPQLKKA